MELGWKVLGVRRGEAHRDLLDFLVRRSQRNAALQLGERLQVVQPVVVQTLLRGEAVRDEEVARAVVAEALGKNADDAVRASVERDRFPHRARVAAESAVECRRAHQRDAVVALQVLVRGEHPSKLRPNPEGREEATEAHRGPLLTVGLIHL